MRRISCLVLASSLLLAAVAEASCRIDAEDIFPRDREGVRLTRPEGLEQRANIAVYRAPLAVNTDGAPNSYHPEDFLGARLAINRIDNGIGIRRANGQALSVQEKRQVFEMWRTSPNWTVPEGYRINWGNVIAATSTGTPCVFQSGPQAGYFGSLTALKNGLSGAAAGECQVNDQLDQRVIPAIVLRGGASNPLTGFGARTGDLVLAANPENGAVIAAIIGDTGDGHRIGEGSVALNMALLRRTVQPRNYPEALRLDTGSIAMAVAVLPGTRTYRRVRPYTAANISSRVDAWAAEHGYGSRDALAAALLRCSEGL
jgi:hypothetical protein